MLSASGALVGFLYCARNRLAYPLGVGRVSGLLLMATSVVDVSGHLGYLNFSHPSLLTSTRRAFSALLIPPITSSLSFQGPEMGCLVTRKMCDP